MPQSRDRVAPGGLRSAARAWLPLLRLTVLGVGLVPGGAGAAELPAGASADWWPRAQRALGEREYHASPNAAGLQAPNRAHALRTYFEPSGIRVVDRTADGSAALVALRLAAIGRGLELAAVAPGTVSSEGARVEIRRPGLVEWYVNRPEGLEQGFTIAERSAGAGPLVLELAVSDATARARGSDLVLETSSGRTLHYGKLHVTDAHGIVQTARLGVRGSAHVQLVVEDAEAAYPLTIDPLLTGDGTPDTLIESNQAGAILGVSVAAAGDVNGDGYGDVIVGAPRFDNAQTDEGAAFIYLGTASDPPTAPSTRLESNQASADMGRVVAGAGDVNGDGYADVIVGARFYNSPENDEGAAFVFLGGPAGIPNGNPLTASAMLQSNQASANMGHGVAGAGDVNGDGYADVIVGAINYDDGETNEGAAFVFLGGPAGIANGNPSTATTKIQANQASADLGRSVAAAGDVNGDGYGDVIVGARFWDSNAMETNEGAAFVFLGSPAGIVASGNPANADAVIQSNQSAAELGRGVSGAGDVNGDGYADVIVGAYLYNAPEADEGAAFVFLGSAAGIADGTPTTAHAQLESDQAGALFGLSVAGAGDINGDGYADVIVGASSYDDVAINAGGAFVFLGGALGIGDGTADTADAKLTSTYASANMGESVASAGDVNGDGFADVIVGASVFDSPENDEGAAFVFLGSNRGIVDGSTGTAAAWLSGFASDIYPLSMAGAGDVNGDGYADVIVGHPSFQDHGAAFVFLGGPAGIAYGSTATAAAELTSSQYGALMGSSVDGAGDVNGDGYDDVIVGAPHYTEGGAYLGGAAFVFLGSPTGIADGSEATAATRVWSGQAAAWMGNVAGVGDVNGDGYGDVMVGAPGYESQASEDDEGAAFIFLGSATGIADGELASAATRIESNQSAAWLGSSLAGAGDVNGDGFADVIVGNALNCSGSAYIFHGSASGVANGTPATAATQLDTDESCARFGQTLDGAGDVNADGYADVIVGASHYFSPTSEEGAAFIFLGGAGGIADGTPATADTRLESDQLEAWFGSSVSGAGDVNADGYADVIVGAYFYDDEPQANDGAAFVFLGGAGGIPNGTAEPSAAAMIQGDFANGYSGIVAGPGDVNGDGYADVMIGTRQPGVGNVSVHLGNGGELGRPTVAQQLRGDGSGTAVSPWGKSDLDGFAVRMHVMHPEGRGRAKLEVEHCQAGVPFGNPSCEAAISPAWIDVGVGVINGTVSLTVPLTDLDASLYRWRARVLHAPYRVTQAGITPPPKPAHGPWRRVGAQSVEADVRIPARICDDGLDNDLDGLVDFPADPGCSSGSDTSEHSASLVCDDGLDNDGDGFTDDPADPGCFSVTSAIENPRCQDGIDNDSDGKFDFDGGASANGGVALGLPDPQCTAPHRNKETPNSCGLGVEIVPALALLRAVRRRVRRSDSRMMGWATK